MNIKKMTTCAVIAAAYAALSLLLAPISYGNVQIRVSEALTILPFIAPYTTTGLFIGCLLANLLNPLGINLLDVIFGSLTTLLAGLLTARCKNRWLASLPPHSAERCHCRRRTRLYVGFRSGFLADLGRFRSGSRSRSARRLPGRRTGSVEPAQSVRPG